MTTQGPVSERKIEYFRPTSLGEFSTVKDKKYKYIIVITNIERINKLASAAKCPECDMSLHVTAKDVYLGQVIQLSVLSGMWSQLGGTAVVIDNKYL